MAIGSLVAAALTYWVGRRAGDMGLPRLVSPGHLERMKTRLEHAGMGAVAAAAVLPPPFPLTPFVLTCGALGLDRWRFFLVFGLMRLIRFGTVALLARQYGERVLTFLDSEPLQTGVLVLLCVAFTTAIASGVTLWRRTRAVAV
jgi:membrane protein DedA with SNARE-associated domain